MIELYYDAYSIAYFIVSQEMGTKRTMEFIHTIYNAEKEFLHPYYHGNKKKFFLDVLYWSDYLVDKEKLDAEFPAIERDFQFAGRKLDKESVMSDYPEFDLFFMILRLRIKYTGNQSYVRMKLRTLLKNYGYKRRSKALMEHIMYCMMFYHIQPYLRNSEECDIRIINLDDMITFRVI